MQQYDESVNKQKQKKKQRLQKHLEEQLKAEEDDHYIEYLQQSILFGRCLIEATNNEVMMETYDSYRDKTLRLAMVNWKLRPQEKHYSANQLNSDIYEAIVSKEYEKIKTIQKKYFLFTRERFITRGIL